MEPTDFFAKTYRASDLRAILVNALRRTARGTGSPVAIVSTEFGGGKTHALISLYHTFRSPDEAKPYLEKWGVIYSISNSAHKRVLSIDFEHILIESSPIFPKKKNAKTPVKPIKIPEAWRMLPKTPLILFVGRAKQRGFTTKEQYKNQATSKAKKTTVGNKISTCSLRFSFSGKFSPYFR